MGSNKTSSNSSKKMFLNKQRSRRRTTSKNRLKRKSRSHKKSLKGGLFAPLYIKDNNGFTWWQVQLPHKYNFYINQYAIGFKGINDEKTLKMMQEELHPCVNFDTTSFKLMLLNGENIENILKLFILEGKDEDALFDIVFGNPQSFIDTLKNEKFNCMENSGTKKGLVKVKKPTYYDVALYYVNLENMIKAIQKTDSVIDWDDRDDAAFITKTKKDAAKKAENSKTAAKNFADVITKVLTADPPPATTAAVPPPATTIAVPPPAVPTAEKIIQL